MKWSVQIIGRPSLAYAREGLAEYQKRLQRFASLSIDCLGKDRGKEENSRLHLERSRGSLRIALDERGEAWDTAELLKKVNAWEQRSVKRVSLMVGGADGHDASLRESADYVWALSPLTLQHELALVVLLEQIYRIYTLKRGEPYHR